MEENVVLDLPTRWATRRCWLCLGPLICVWMVQKLVQECTEKVPKPKHDIWIPSPHWDLKNANEPCQKDQFWLKCFHLRFNDGCYHKYCPVYNTCNVRKTSTLFFRRYNVRAAWPLIENYFSFFNPQHVTRCIGKKMGRVCHKRLVLQMLEAFVLQVFIWIEFSSLYNTILSKPSIFKTWNVCHRSACIFWSQVK